jgi:hypothetical protein
MLLVAIKQARGLAGRGGDQSGRHAHMLAGRLADKVDEYRKEWPTVAW